MINAKPTQNFIPIKEIKDGILILKDNSMRAILMASSLNFALKNPDEQQAILYQFQDLLNSLDFTTQIHIQSRRLDIRPYLNYMRERLNVQTSDLLKLQTAEYIEFIKGFTDTVSIMSKDFFVVIPYSGATIDLKQKSGLFGKKEKVGKKEQAEKSFEENLLQLDQRISVVEQGLHRCGIRSVRLGTEELVELFYKLFNPGEAGTAPQTEASEK